MRSRIASLPLWTGPVRIKPLPGGLTNRNFRVENAGRRYVVRLSGDVAAHDIDRTAELAATRAAASVGLGPAVIHAEPGVLVLAHIEGQTLAAMDLARPRVLAQAVALLGQIARDMPAACHGPLRDRSPRAVLTAYVRFLAGTPWRDAAARYADAIAELSAETTAFVHGDIHAGNLIDDGARLWLVDWEYAGQGASLSDLASLVNNGADTDAALSLWLGRAPTLADCEVFRRQRRGPALRDLFWGYAQAAIEPGFDTGYIAINEARVKALLT